MMSKWRAWTWSWRLAIARATRRCAKCWKPIPSDECALYQHWRCVYGYTEQKAELVVAAATYGIDLDGDLFGERPVRAGESYG